MSPRKVWNDGMEIVESDLSAVSSALELELYDRYLYETRNRQQNIIFGDGLTVSYVNSVTSQVKLGNGLYFDNTQTDPEPMARLIALLTNTNVTHAAADGTNNRIDIVSVKADRSNITSATRNYKDPTTGVVTATSQVIESDWRATLLVTTGTPSGSPAVPSTPAGYIKLAEVLVTAVTGIGSSAAYTDKRPRYQKPSGWCSRLTKTASYTIDLDDETVLGDATAGNITLTLPAAATADGKKVTVNKKDSSGNTVTLAGSGAELINDANTQVISTQYSSLQVVCDGTKWYIV